MLFYTCQVKSYLPACGQAVADYCKSKTQKQNGCLTHFENNYFGRGWRDYAS